MRPKKKKSAAGRKARGGTPQAGSLTLSDLDQVKVLADPLRIRILEEMCTAERTTKQVAQRLGEKPTKLYHHVEALERVGLIRSHTDAPEPWHDREVLHGRRQAVQGGLAHLLGR